MATLQIEQEKRQKRSVALAVLLVAQALIVLSILAPPPTQVVANEASTLSSTSQLVLSSDTEDLETVGYEVYSFSSQEFFDMQIGLTERQGGIIVPNQVIPLSQTQLDSVSNSNDGSVFNTALVVISILIMGAMLVLLLVRRTSDYRVIAVRTIAVAFGLVTVVIWSLFDRLQVPTAMFNNTSTLLIAIFSIYVIMAIVSYFYEVRVNNKSALERWV